MESTDVVIALAALAQESRLAVYRLLVEAGEEGLAASDIADRLDIAAPTLSFHLKALSHAGLLHARQAGRFIFYSANYPAMNELMAYLTDNCCRGGSCAPRPSRRRVQ